MGDEHEHGGDSVVTTTGGLFCDQCGDAIPPPKRKTRFPKRFCQNKCRAQWHKARKAERLASARHRINQALDDLGSL